MRSRSQENVGAGSAAPTLELRAAIFRREGVDLNAALSLRSEARALGLVGDWDFLFEALTGQASCGSGSAKLLGVKLGRCLSAGLVGFAACDPPLPATFTVQKYLEHAARLGQGVSGSAKAHAEQALESFGLSHAAAQLLPTLVPYQRRALGLAQASLGAPRLVCVQTPLRGLDAASADHVLSLVQLLAEQRRLIVTALAPLTPSPERTLLDACQEVVVLEGGVVATTGAPSVVFAPPRQYSLTLLGDGGEQFEQLARALGTELTSSTVLTNQSRVLPPGAILRHYVARLPSGGNSDALLDAALEANMAVVELEPIRTR